MKELSIEEKAKACDSNYKVYTELINRLEDVKEAIKKQNYGIAMDVLCKSYPEFQVTTHSELKEESDDERIRKRICKLLWDNVPYEEAQEYIAWLEKQNEQKPVFEMKTVSESLGFTTQKECDDYNKMVTDLIMSDDGKGEQKPAWSKEDEDMCYKAIAVINRLCAKGKDYVWSIKTLEKLFYWLKSLKDRVGCEVNCTTTWKPSDERMKQLHKYCPDNRPITQLYQDLKKLKG